MRKEYTDGEVWEYGYKYLNKKIKCPECGRTMITYTSEDIAGNYFCFYDDCDFDGWRTELDLAKNGNWPLPKEGYKLAFGDTIAWINDSNKVETDVNYIVTFPDYPGLTGGGDTVDGAIKMAREALDMLVEIERDDKSDVLSEEGNRCGK